MQNSWRRRREETTELWLASAVLGAIVLSSLLLHCCIFGNDAHGGAPLCAKIAIARAQPASDHPAAAEPPPKQTAKIVSAAIGESRFAQPQTIATFTFVGLYSAFAKRNAMTLGAMRIDDDVGLNDLHATYLI